MGQGIWLDSEKLGPNDKIKEILKHGTLSVGFIGLAECLVALIGKHHGESQEAQELGLKIIAFMRKLADERSQEMQMNFTLLATPAEGLSGRFVRIDKNRFGVLEGVTDKEYYTNSFHIPVGFNISALEKMKIEAPYHELTNAGHVSYVEIDGDPLNNLEAFEKLVRAAHDLNMGYFAINHPVDTDPVCGYIGVIGDVCPVCGRREGESVSIERLKELSEKFSCVKNHLRNHPELSE
jgi:ribonucleoside-triphosphate reductase